MTCERRFPFWASSHWQCTPEVGSIARFSPSEEADFQLFVFQDFHPKKLQGDGSSELGVFGFIDDTHAASAEFGEDLRVADGGADHDAQIVPLPDSW